MGQKGDESYYEKSPGEIPGLVLWLDGGKDVYEAGCVIPAQNTFSVGCWKDQSSQHNDAVTAMYPSYSYNALNGKPAVSFNGSNSLQGSLISGIDSQLNSTVILVTQTFSNDGIYRPIFYYNNATEKLAFEVNNGSYSASWASSYMMYPVGGATIETAVINQKNIMFYFNGFYKASGFIFTVWTMGPHNYTLGSLNADYFVGAIGEVIVYNRPINEEEREGVERYLSRKYAIELQ
jgi:hypothetical protein